MPGKSWTQEWVQESNGDMAVFLRIRRVIAAGWSPARKTLLTLFLQCTLELARPEATDGAAIAEVMRLLREQGGGAGDV